MECPEECPEDVYNTMKKCWEWDPNLRPTFKQIYSELENMFQESINTTTTTPISNDEHNANKKNSFFYQTETNGNSIKNNNVIKIQQKNQPVLSSFTSSSKLQTKNILPPKPPERSCSFKDTENLQQQCVNNQQNLDKKDVNDTPTTTVISVNNDQQIQINNLLIKSLGKYGTMSKLKEPILQDNYFQQQNLNELPSTTNASNEFQRVFSNLKKVNKTVENNNNSENTIEIERKLSINNKKVFPKTQFNTSCTNSDTLKYQSTSNITTTTTNGNCVESSSPNNNEDDSDLKRNCIDRLSTRSYGKVYYLSDLL
jgi:hypothetical protein